MSLVVDFVAAAADVGAAFVVVVVVVVVVAPVAACIETSLGKQPIVMYFIFLKK